MKIYNYKYDSIKEEIIKTELEIVSEDEVSYTIKGHDILSVLPKHLLDVYFCKEVFTFNDILKPDTLNQIRYDCDKDIEEIRQDMESMIKNIEKIKNVWYNKGENTDA